VQLLDQELMHAALGPDRSQLDDRGARLAGEPVDRRGERLGSATAADHRRAQEAVHVLEGHQR